jgi:hypothetical protein
MSDATMSINRLLVSSVALLLLGHAVESFQPHTSLDSTGSTVAVLRKHPPLCAHRDHEEGECASAKASFGRRSFVGGLSILFAVSHPRSALAGIDISGLQVEGGKGGNSVIANQLKAYDGSGSARVQEIKQQTTSAPSVTTKRTVDAEKPDPNAATNALRYTEPRMSKAGLLTSRYEGQIVGPTSKPLLVSFEFPSDWLQLDKFLGGVQYVDQRNGDKLYLLRATLPEDATLETVPKQWFGDVLFNPNGSIVKQVGNEVDEYKVSKSQVTTISGGAPHRRALLKFFTVTGNGLRVERRGLVDAYQVDNDVYMILTSSNANKFEAKGQERDTVDSIVNSFRVERQ